MQMRPLGRSGLSVPPLAFGGNVFGWTVDEAGSFELLDAMVDLGMTFIDTADMYSTWVPGNRGGESETLIGKWLRKSGKRDQVVLATKVGMEMGPDAKGLSPGYIARAVEDSLRRLQTDRIDLYQSHVDDGQVPLADTLGAYARLIEQGKVRAIGASNYSAPRLEEALRASAEHGLPRYESIQPEYNLHTREPFESGLQAVVVEHGLGTINYYALASGFLTGKYRSASDTGKSVRGKRVVERYLDERGKRILAALDEAAAALRATPAQVALAWQKAQPGITAPIASATTRVQLEELAGAMRLELPADVLSALDRASAWR